MGIICVGTPNGGYLDHTEPVNILVDGLGVARLGLHGDTLVLSVHRGGLDRPASSSVSITLGAITEKTLGRDDG